MLKRLVRTSAMALMAFPILVASPTTSGIPQNTNSPSENSLATQKNSEVAFSAKINAKKDDRHKILAKFLKERNSPMAKDAKKLVKIADKYNIDWKLLPAIAGVESQYGHMVPAGSHNPYGWNNGSAYFKDWAHASEHVASGIRTRYAPSGEVTPWRIGPSYAANPSWASHVSNYMYQISQT